jgi:hypothetical protein
MTARLCIVELTASEEKMNDFLTKVRSYGTKRVARTGKIVLTRAEKKAGRNNRARSEATENLTQSLPLDDPWGPHTGLMEKRKHEA